MSWLHAAGLVLRLLGLTNAATDGCGALPCWPPPLGLVISPLLTVLTGQVSPADLGDASTLFSIWQQIAWSVGVGLIAAAFASQSAAHARLMPCM